MTKARKNAAKPLGRKIQEVHDMSDYVKEVREALRKEIAELSKIAWLFSQHPEKDFTRKSPLQFSKLVESLICMGGNSIQLELLKLFHMNQKTP
ncbi:MAG: hypothetical protein RSA55_08915, partial [Clostridia bacterium]